MRTYLFRTLLLCAGFAALQTAVAQTVLPSNDAMREALVKSSQIADLEAAGAAPFRLKATFTTFDWQGKPAGDGTLEETWLKPGTERRVITFRGVTWTQIASGGSVRGTGDNFEGSFMERRLVEALLHAVPPQEKITSAAGLEYKPMKMKTGTLDCVLMSPLKVRKQDANGTDATVTLSAAEAAKSAYCMDPASHLVRLVQERFSVNIAYNKIAHLGQHAIGEEIGVFQDGKTRGTLSVSSFEAAPGLTEAEFALPANGRDMSVEDVEIPGKILAGRILKKIAPIYPPEAKQEHISGTVILSAIIGTDGAIRELDLVSSPSPLLTESAMQCVKLWRYQPYLLNGAPTDVSTTITVNYSFSR